MCICETLDCAVFVLCELPVQSRVRRTRDVGNYTVTTDIVAKLLRPWVNSRLWTWNWNGVSYHSSDSVQVTNYVYLHSEKKQKRISNHSVVCHMCLDANHYIISPEWFWSKSVWQCKEIIPSWLILNYVQNNLLLEELCFSKL